MKKFSRIILSAVLVFMLVCASVVTSFAAEVLVVNGKEATVGSTVTYTFSIGDAHQKLCGIHLILFFDQDCLELTDVDASALEGGTIINDNKNNDGRVIITNSFINGTEGLDCSETKDVVTATFKVIKDGSTDITYYVPYLYDIDTVNIYDYTFSSSIAVDGQVVVATETPVLEDVQKLDNFRDAGDFENNVEGTGSGVKPVVTQAQQQGGNHGGSSGNGGNSKSAVPIICVGVIVAAIVALVVVKTVNGKKNQNSDEDTVVNNSEH